MYVLITAIMCTYCDILQTGVAQSMYNTITAKEFEWMINNVKLLSIVSKHLEENVPFRGRSGGYCPYSCNKQISACNKISIKDLQCSTGQVCIELPITNLHLTPICKLVTGT